MLAVLVEARPTGRLMEVISTVFALGHEGKVGKKVEPIFWQAKPTGENEWNNSKDENTNLTNC